MRGSKYTLCCAMAAVALSAAGAVTHAQTRIPPDAAETCSLTKQELRGWFAPRPVTANGPVAVPNSVDFPNPPPGKRSLPDCVFYKWAEHMFLWVTSRGPLGTGSYEFESSTFLQVPAPDQSVDQRLIAGSDTPRSSSRNLTPAISQRGPRDKLVVFDPEGNMYEIAQLKGGRVPVILRENRPDIAIGHLEENPVTHLPIFYDTDGNVVEDPVVLRDTSGTVITPRPYPIRANGQLFFLDQPINLQQRSRAIAAEPGQADHSVLMARGNKIIYYMIQVNDIYAYFQSGVINKKLPFSQFPTQMDQVKRVEDYARGHNIYSFPDESALVVALKSSWIELPKTDLNKDKYVWIDATIPIYEEASTPNRHLETHRSHTVPLAMVGMHVAFAVKGHPELIWATFEHVDNTPNAPYQYRTKHVETWSRQACGTWRFSSGPGEPDYPRPAGEPPPPPRVCNGKEISVCAPGKTINAKGTCARANDKHMYLEDGKIYAVFGEDFDASDILRLSPWGSAQLNSAGQNADIISLNKSVHNLLASGDVRKNYLIIGAMWLDDPVLGSGGPQCSISSTRGTRCVANSTMETFQQSASCLKCHSSVDFSNPQAPRDMLGISHIFKRLAPLFHDPPNP
jgi:hypothetical protein